MSALLIILLVLLIVGGFGGYRYGGPGWSGGWVGVLLLVIVVLALTGRL